MQPPSPRIQSLRWGQIEIEGRTGKDFKLFPGGARAWDWAETGTRHVPGIQIEDVRELVERGAEVVVLSRGMHERLQVCAETLSWLEQQGVAVHVLQTEAAAERYNELVGSRAVGGLFHSTC